MTGVIVGRRFWFLSLTVAFSGALVPASVASAAPPTCGGERATIVGTDGRDTIRGTGRDDVIVALGGRDAIDGGSGNDIICGGTNFDRLQGGGGNDRLFGQGDGCYWDEGCFYYGDELSGGAGDDRLVGGDQRAPDVVVFTGAKRGVVVDLEAGTSTGQGADILVGMGDAVTTPYDDVVSGQRGSSYVRTGAGDDRVTVTAPGWYGFIATGDGADDVTTAGRGDVDTGEQDDTLETTGNGVLARMGDGDDTVHLGGAGYVETGAGDDVVEGSARGDDIETDGGNDTVRAGAGHDYVRDGAGQSLIEGGEGDDWIQGGRGVDSYDGGTGTDEIDYLQLYGESGLVLDLAAGTATGVSGADTLSAFEDATGSPQADTIHGDDGPNRLDGDEGNDTVHGRGGADHLIAVWGSPELYGDAGDDVLELSGYAGTVNGLGFDGGADRDLFWISDYIGFEADAVLDLTAESITGMGTAPLVGIEDLTDNGGSHTLIGDDGPNVLSGRGGRDTLVGNGGDDTGDGGAGTDSCDTETKIACEE